LVQIIHQHPPAAIVVRQNRRGAGELRIGAVDEHQPDALVDQFLIQVQIGIGQGRLASLDQNAVQPLYRQQGLKNLALRRNLVLRGKEQGALLLAVRTVSIPRKIPGKI
jgi:hypothetical protein